jgi:hypothetical protein
MSKYFNDRELVVDDYWRAIILYGRNVASYKFALAKSLLELKPSAGERVKLEELAPVYARQICSHLAESDKQSTSRSSEFLDACRSFNNQSISQDELVNKTVRLGFNNVIDAFHIVNRDEVDKRFFIDDRKSSNSLMITDEFSELMSNSQAINLSPEVESRWRLVERAWELNVSRNLLRIDYDYETETLFSVDNKLRRKSVTSSRAALNGYQDGQCFYCFDEINIDSEDKDAMPDVDHFFPHMLKRFNLDINIDGICNLVLACKDCNRGIDGKFERVPSLKLLDRLHNRNEYLISSHHPLRETLIKQTGKAEAERKAYLNRAYDLARAHLIHTFEPEAKAEPRF